MKLKSIAFILCMGLLVGCGILRDARSYRNYWVKNSVGFMCVQCAFEGRVERARMVAETSGPPHPRKWRNTPKASITN